MKLDEFAKLRRDAEPPDEVRRRLVVSVSEVINARPQRLRHHVGVYATATGVAVFMVMVLLARQERSVGLETPVSSAYFASTIQMNDMTAIMLVAETNSTVETGR